jgi:chromatin modification-related protein VID21
MSLDSLRETLRQEKTNEAALTSATLERHLRALWKVTGCCNAALNGHQPRADDFVYGEPDEDERRFLDENDISQGRRFNDATLPFPVAVTDHQPPLPATLPFQNATKSFIKSSPSPVVGTPSLEDQLRVASASPSVATQTLPSVEPSLQSDTIHVTPSVKDASRAASPTVEDEVANQTPFEAAPAVQAVGSQDDLPADTSTVDPSAIASPTTERIIPEKSCSSGEISLLIYDLLCLYLEPIVRSLYGITKIETQYNARTGWVRI